MYSLDGMRETRADRDKGTTRNRLSPNEAGTWLTPPNPEASHLPRLYCFANAGGNAELFRQWQASLAETLAVCPVELPGRGRRIGEPFCTSLSEAAEAAADAIAGAGHGAYCIFGHSLGSVLALETTRALMRTGHPLPNCLFLSGRIAPHLAEGERKLHTCSDADIVEELRRLGGTPEELLTERVFLDFILPIVRDDYRLLETYSPALRPIIHCPTHICCGEVDEDAPLSLLERWNELTATPCQLRLFKGGHFYVNTQQDELVDYIRKAFLACA